jgi:hypothetical protein
MTIVSVILTKEESRFQRDQGMDPSYLRMTELGEVSDTSSILVEISMVVVSGESDSRVHSHLMKSSALCRSMITASPVVLERGAGGERITTSSIHILANLHMKS